MTWMSEGFLINYDNQLWLHQLIVKAQALTTIKSHPDHNYLVKNLSGTRSMFMDKSCINLNNIYKKKVPAYRKM